MLPDGDGWEMVPRALNWLDVTSIVSTRAKNESGLVDRCPVYCPTSQWIKSCGTSLLKWISQLLFFFLFVFASNVISAFGCVDSIS
jgi:hypothetical protein